MKKLMILATIILPVVASSQNNSSDYYDQIYRGSVYNLANTLYGDNSATSVQSNNFGKITPYPSEYYLHMIEPVTYSYERPVTQEAPVSEELKSFIYSQLESLYKPKKDE